MFSLFPVAGRRMQLIGRRVAARVVLCMVCAFTFGGCALLAPLPSQRVGAQAREAQFQPVAAINGPLKAWLRTTLAAPDHEPASPLTVYIEGDGAEWPAVRQPPADPTPVNALTLRLALRDPGQRVAYLGRPCQYLDHDALAACAPRLWIRARYGEQALRLMSDAIDTLLRLAGAQRVQLVGYSGGGVVAALIAARRSDVSCLVTLAAPLDIAAWTAALDITPLSESLNPLDDAPRLAAVAQTHFAAGADAVVPPRTLSRVIEALPQGRVQVLDAYDHDCCWVYAWQSLRQQTCLAAP